MSLEPTDQALAALLMARDDVPFRLLMDAINDALHRTKDLGESLVSLGAVAADRLPDLRAEAAEAEQNPPPDRVGRSLDDTWADVPRRPPPRDLDDDAAARAPTTSRTPAQPVEYDWGDRTLPGAFSGDSASELALDDVRAAYNEVAAEAIDPMGWETTRPSPPARFPTAPSGDDAAHRDPSADREWDDGGPTRMPTVRPRGPTSGVDVTLAPADGPLSPSGREPGERYQFLGEIGRGGMGRILKARDSEISREVAVKVLLAPGGQTSEGQIRRFWTEVQALGQLEHPSIIPIHDVGRLASGELFYVMKKLEGRTLADVLSALRSGDPASAREFTRARLLTSLQQVAYAVAFAHAHGVIHRDIKPANIMIGQYGEAILIDWGLAKILESPSAPVSEDAAWPQSASSTASGTITGTPQYMSPEATEGQPDLLTTRSDVYGLGAVLYEILTGEPPYPDLGFVPTVMRVRQADADPPRERSPDRNISPGLEELCLSAMARDPSDRPLAKEVADELGRVLEGAKERERRSAEAKARVRAGRQAMDRWKTLKVELQSAEAEAKRMAKEVPSWGPVEDKAPVWTLEDRVSELKIEAVSAFEGAEADFLRALGEVPDDREARSALASLYFARFGEAERARDSEGQRYYRRLVDRYDDGVWQRVLEGNGTLEVSSAPTATVSIAKFETVQRVMRTTDSRDDRTDADRPI